MIFTLAACDLDLIQNKGHSIYQFSIFELNIKQISLNYLLAFNHFCV